MSSQTPIDPTQLDQIIDKLEKALLNADPTSEDATKYAEQLGRLTKIRETNRLIDMKNRETDANIRAKDADVNSKNDEMARRRRVSPETWALIGANIFGIILVMKQEQFNIVTSKAFGMVKRIL